MPCSVKPRAKPHGAATAAAPIFAITSHQRDPLFFAGLRGEDVDDWLDQFTRVSAFNRWDDSFKLYIVGFYLTKVAKTWFLNEGSRITDWTYFKEEIRKIFGTPSTRSDIAKRKLASRVQHPEETYASYIEDVLALCCRVDAAMPEADKVRHLLKGIAPFPFNALAAQNPASVSDVRTTCQRLDELHSIRLHQDAGANELPGDVDLRALIRSIIREELQLRDPPASSRDSIRSDGPHLRDLVKQELASMAGIVPTMPSVPVPTMPSYSAIAAKPPLPMEVPPAHGHLSAISSAAPFQTYYNGVRPVRRAFSNDRPVCYYCGIRGHISRFCRRRQQDERRGYAPFERDIRFAYGAPRNQYVSPTRRYSPPPAPVDTPYNKRSSRRRCSPSPYRRSVSPLRPASDPTNYQSEN